jgi:type III secretion protein V
VTRAEGQDGRDLGTDISAELVADPRVTAIGAPIVLGIGFIPGFPTSIFAIMAGGMLVISFAVRRSIRAAQTAVTHAALAQEADAARAKLAGAALPIDDRVRLKIDRGVTDDLDIKAIDGHITAHLGALYAARGVRFPRPVVEVSDTADRRGIVVEIDEVPVFREIVPTDRFLIIGPVAEDMVVQTADENPVRWRLIDGVWLPMSQRADIAKREIAETDISTAVGYMAFRVYEQNLGSLFSNTVFSELMGDARAAEPELMEKIEELMDQGALYKVFRYLVEDGVPLRPLALVISSMRYWLTTLEEMTPTAMAECLRGSLKRQLCHRIAGEDGVLGLALLGPELESLARKGLAEGQRIGLDMAHDGLVLNEDARDRLIQGARQLQDRRAASGRQIALVVAPDLRRRVGNFLASHNVHLPVLSPHEIATEISCYPLELIEAEDADMANVEIDALRRTRRSDRDLDLQMADAAAL